MARTTISMPRQTVRDFGTCISNNGAGWVFVSTSGTNLRSSVFTFSAWIKPSPVAGGVTRTIIGDAGGSGGRQFLLNSNGTMSLNKENVTVMATTIQKVPNGQWSHVAVTYDASGNYVFYINSVSVLSGTNLQTFTHGDLDINRQNTGEFFVGLTDEVQISNTVATSTEIAGVYTGTSNLSSLQGYWKFNEGSGTVAIDSSGNGRTGSLSTLTYSTDVVMVPRTTAGQRQTVRDFGTCIKCNGTSGTAYTASVWSSAKTNISMGAWFKSTNYKNNRQPIISNGSGAVAGYAIELSGNATTDGSIMLLNHTVAWIDCGFKVQDNNWHHIMLTIDGSNNAVIYLDGVSRYTGTPTLGTPATLSSVGSDTVAVAAMLIDEARFYSSKLTATEVLNLYYGVEPSTTPIDWYKFNEGSGITATDSGSGAKDITITTHTYSTDVFMIGRTVAT